MQEYLWLWFALASSLITAQNVEMNRRLGQEGFRLNMWRMAMAALFWLPLAALQPWPDFAQHGLFYIAAIFSGAAVMVGFTIQTELSHRHNGRVAVLHLPLKAVAVFVIWAMLDPASATRYLENPLKVAGILVCLGIMSGALFAFRRNDVSMQSLKAVMPIVLLYTAGDLFARHALTSGDLQQTLVVFLFLMSLSSAVVSVLMLPWRPKPELPLWHPRLLRAAGWASLAGTLNQILFFAALALGKNPAYVSMIALLAPVWLLIYHRVANIPDNASPVAGTAIVLAAMTLMYLVA